MKVYGLTARQRQLLEFIQAYTRAHGRAPSFRDMMEGMGFKSPSAAHRLVVCLEQRGCIRRLPDQARTIVITEEAFGNACAGLPDNLARTVAVVAASRGMTTNAFVEEAVRAHLITTRRPAERAAA